MKINEVEFSRPWDLITGTETTEHVKSEIRKSGISGLIQVWQKSDDPHQIVMTFERNGAWEVHHAYVDTQGNFISGKRLSSEIRKKSPDIDFLATMKRIYEQHMNRDRKIRITARPRQWKIYKKVIERLLKNHPDWELGKYTNNDIGADGKSCVSQEIKPVNQFKNINERLNSNPDWRKLFNH